MLCRLLRRFPTLAICSASPLLPNLITTINASSSSFTSAAAQPPRLLLCRRWEQRSRTFSTRTRATEDTSAAAYQLHNYHAPYLSVSIHCKRDDAVEFSEALLCFGASSASMDEQSSSADTNEIGITSIFADDNNVVHVEACISRAAASIGMEYVPSFVVSVGEQCDWVTKVQEDFCPIEVISGLWIIPKWSKEPDSQGITITLDPGMAFGTGEHPTTKLCLLLLHGLMKGGERFLDYGTGSGILGIAAVKMGAALSVGIDIEPQAVISTRQNLLLNKIDPDRMLVFLVAKKSSHDPFHKGLHEIPQGQMLHDVEFESEKGSYDIVVANILLNPLLELADDIVGYAKPGAVVGVSGILLEQVPRTMDCYSKYLEDISVSDMDGWACLSGIKQRIDRCNSISAGS